MRTRLRPGEEIVGVARRHGIVLTGPIAVALFVLGGAIAAGFVKRPHVLPVAVAAFGLAALWAAWRWLEWRCDLWVVTTHRVVDESGVLALRVVDSPLDKIHNVACAQSVLGRLLGYGTLNIQTAAEMGSTTITTVASPVELKDAILHAQEGYRDTVAARQAAPLVAAAVAASGGALAAGASGPGAGPPASEMRECPHCAETIKARAKICRYCGRDV